MEWPSYSSDLNPIENLWALLKKKAYKIYSDLDSLQGKGDEAETQLFQILFRAWANIRKKVIDGLIASMLRRCAAVIKAKGWHTMVRGNLVISECRRLFGESALEVLSYVALGSLGSLG